MVNNTRLMYVMYEVLKFFKIKFWPLELSPFVDEADVTVSQSNWIPVYLSGDDLPGSMSISKIAKYLILPLADWKISILALSMYQSDYILVNWVIFYFIASYKESTLFFVDCIYFWSTRVENFIHFPFFNKSICHNCLFFKIYP